LAEISQKIDVVIATLKAMTVWLDEKIEDVAPNIFQSQINGNILVIENSAPRVRQRIASAQERRDVGEARRNLTENIGAILNWQRFGFTYYYKVIAAITFQLYATKALGEPLHSQRKVIEVVIEYLNAAVDFSPSAVKSVEHARQVKEEQRNTAARMIADRRDRWWLTNLKAYSESQGRDDFPVWTTFYDWIARKFTGEIGGPYQYERSSVEGDDAIPEYAWYPELGRHFDYGDGESSLADMSRGVQRLTNNYLALKEQERVLSSHVATIKACIKMLEDTLARR